MKQIGTVEILRERTYPLDPEADRRFGGTEVIVKDGTYPVFSDGITTFWMMTGVLSDGGMRRMGDGLVMMTGADIPSEISATFPSLRLGANELHDLLNSPVCAEGDPAQRLRFHIAQVAA